MTLHEVAHDRQSETEPAFRASGPLPAPDEQVEDLRQHLGGDPDARVADADAYLVGVARGGDRDGTAWRRVACSVGEQVGDDLRDARRIDEHRQARARHVDGERVRSRFEERARHLDTPRDDVGRLDGRELQLHLAARDSRDVEEIVDQTREVLHLSFDDDALALRLLAAA